MKKILNIKNLKKLVYFSNSSKIFTEKLKKNSNLHQIHIQDMFTVNIIINFVLDEAIF